MAALERRSQDIASNMMDVNELGQLTPGTPERSIFWWELWTHVLEELALRQVPYGSANLMTPDQFPWVSHPAKPRGQRILGNRKLPASYLARLGQREHLKASMNIGRFRIAPAASYADPSLNPAIQDDELSVTAVRSADTAIIQPLDPVTGKRRPLIRAVGEITYSKTLQDNFYVLCMATHYSPRLLDDFNADALIAITNPNRFLLRLERAVKEIRPELSLVAGVVHYYDPYRAQAEQLDPFFAKNFRYAYQREYRFVWAAEGLPMNAEPFFVEIGNMRDIASIFVLRG
jgi:hypothetical protein